MTPSALTNLVVSGSAAGVRGPPAGAAAGTTRRGARLRGQAPFEDRPPPY